MLARSWRCPSGEIDNVLGRNGLVVFAEVTNQSTMVFGHLVSVLPGRIEGAF